MFASSQHVSSPFLSPYPYFTSFFLTTAPPYTHFTSLRSTTHHCRYDDGRGGSKSAIIAPGSDSTTNSYPGHVFCFSEKGVSTGGCEPQHSLAKVQVGPHNYTYLFDDGTASAAHVQAWEVRDLR